MSFTCVCVFQDKKYASDKYKDIYTELSIVKAKADCDINKLREKLLAATEALGELDAEGSGVTPGYGERFKGIIHAKITILSSFNRPHVLFDFVSSIVHKRTKRQNYSVADVGELRLIKIYIDWN